MLFALALQLQIAIAPPHADPWFGVDKAKHFLFAAHIQSVSYATLRAITVRHRPAIWLASTTTVSLATLKEIRDRRRGGRFSVRDLAWGVAGAAAATAIVSRTAR